MINQVHPERFRDYTRKLDKPGIQELMTQIADENNPELYRDVLQALYRVGHLSAHSAGSSFSIRDLKVPVGTQHVVNKLNTQVTNIINQDGLTDEQRDAAITKLTLDATPQIDKMLMREMTADNNPFAIQVLSGSRGGPADLRSLVVGDMLVTDQNDNVISMPMATGYAAGLDPAQYWAGSYGARKGTIGTKLATQDAGFWGKQIIQAAHREVVTVHNCDTDRGLPLPANDPDNVGAVLAIAVKGKTGDYPAGTVLDPRNMRDIGKQDVIIRSPLTCEAKGGVCAKCVGIRETGDFPEIGDNVGVAAAQALGERLSQGSLNTKHTGGRAEGKARDAEEISGFKLINQLTQVPKAFRGAASVARLDGTIQDIREAPQGGMNIRIGDEEHYVPPGNDINVKPGDRVEAGDVMSTGIPNPAELVRFRGIGAGRLAFVGLFRQAFEDSGLKANRRNIELIARGLINHVRITELDGPDDTLPGDIVEYTSIERNYRPRYGFQGLAPKSAVGRYLERPYLQYSIGTKISKSVAQTMAKHGLTSVDVHTDPPSFEPKMIRAMSTLRHAPDWQVRLGGWHLQEGLLDALHRDIPSRISDVSYIPGLARGKGFGEKLTEEGKY